MPQCSFPFTDMASQQQTWNKMGRPERRQLGVLTEVVVNIHDQVWMVKLVLRQTETNQGVCWLGSQGGQGRNLVGRPKETGQE